MDRKNHRLSRLMTINEVAEYLSVTPRTVRRYAKQNLLRKVKFSGKNVRYRVEDVDELVLWASGAIDSQQSSLGPSGSKAAEEDDAPLQLSLLWESP